jgi:hypothetical protein
MWHIITYTAKLGPVGFFKVIKMWEKQLDIEISFNKMLY